MTIEWRPIPEWPEYEASSDGQVRRVMLKRGTRGAQHLMARSTAVWGGYPFVSLTRDYRSVGHYVHRLVAAAFLGPCPEGMEVNHKDSNRQNNHVDNLEYVTRAENMLHAYRVGGRIQRYGEQSPNSRLTTAQAFEIWQLRQSGIGVRELGRRYAISPRVISKIQSGTAWKRAIAEMMA